MDTVLLAKSAAIRAFRTFIQVVLMFLATNLSEITNVEAARVLAGAAIAAGLAAAWRALLDPTPIPSAKDPAPALAAEKHPLVATSNPPPDVGGRMTRGPL